MAKCTAPTAETPLYDAQVYGLINPAKTLFRSSSVQIKNNNNISTYHPTMISAVRYLNKNDYYQIISSTHLQILFIIYPYCLDPK